jgi:hypothetical protein
MPLDLHGYDALIVAWFFLALVMGHTREYRHTLMANVGSASSFAVYALCAGQPVAAAVTFIAAGSSLIQLLIPLSRARKFVLIRNGLAVSMACAACYWLYRGPLDLLPCAGLFAARLGEAQQSATVMKAGLVTGWVIWVIFGFLAGLYLMVVLNTIIIVVFLYRFWKERGRVSPESAPVG